MEKVGNRELYITEGFQLLRDALYLAEDNVNKFNHFISLVKKHKYFKNHSKNIEDLESDQSKTDQKLEDVENKTKIYYIFLELTNKRKSCEAIISMLEESKLTNAAKILKKYNTSPGLIDILNASQDINIEVLKTDIPIAGSNPYRMEANPRGKFIIIDNIKNTIKNSFNPPNDVFIESDRFQSVFSQLFFKVEVILDLNVIQIENLLKNMKINKKDEAFGLMIITHGENDEILGIDACEGRNPSDRMEIKDVVNYFSYLNRIPKFFIFDCCRIKVKKPLKEIISLKIKFNKAIISSEIPNPLLTDEEMNEEFSDLVESCKKIWVNDNTHNFIIYSCPEGYPSWLIPNFKQKCLSPAMSAFGQTFSHAIARYAREESLYTIMGRTCTLMKKFKEVMTDDYDPQIDVSILPDNVYESASSKPECRLQCAERDLYFNAGV